MPEDYTFVIRQIKIYSKKPVINAKESLAEKRGEKCIRVFEEAEKINFGSLEEKNEKNSFWIYK